MNIKKLLLGKGCSKRDIFIWNMLGSMANALATLFLTVMVTRITGENIAGIFVYAYAIAQQMQTVGFYEMRPYQSTDLQKTYSFSTYLASRIITGSLMLGASIILVFLSGVDWYTALIIILVCVLKSFDVFDDVYLGLFQQNGRLDITGKTLFFRVVSSTIAFLLTLFLTQNLIITCLVSIVVSLFCLIILDLQLAGEFADPKPDFSIKPLKKLLLTCTPLFVGSFMLQYINNAPKFSIQNVMAPEMLTYYNALFMPTFVINLFSGFILKPLLTPMSICWLEEQYKRFASLIAKLIVGIFVFTGLFMIGGYFVGIPILSLVYAVDLAPYRIELLIMLLSGAFNAFSVVFYYAITVMRKQTISIIIYIIMALLSFLFSPLFVKGLGLMGAALVYLIIEIVMSALFFIILIVLIKNSIKKEANKL